MSIATVWMPPKLKWIVFGNVSMKIIQKKSVVPFQKTEDLRKVVFGGNSRCSARKEIRNLFSLHPYGTITTKMSFLILSPTVGNSYNGIQKKENGVQVPWVKTTLQKWQNYGTEMSQKVCRNDFFVAYSLGWPGQVAKVCIVSRIILNMRKRLRGS